ALAAIAATIARGAGGLIRGVAGAHLGCSVAARSRNGDHFASGHGWAIHVGHESEENSQVSGYFAEFSSQAVLCSWGRMGRETRPIGANLTADAADFDCEDCTILDQTAIPPVG